MTTPHLSAFTKAFLNRLIIIGFFVLVGYCLARSISNDSVMGIILALVSLVASIVFLYLLTQAREVKEKRKAV